MAEEKKQEKQTKQDKLQEKIDKAGKKGFEKKEGMIARKPVLDETKVIRFLAKDIPGDKKLIHGLCFIKGISWTFSNAVCKKLGMDKNKKMQDLNAEEIKKIEEFIKNPQLPEFLLNRRKDIDSGVNRHIHGSDLDLQREFDIKRLKKMKCYKGIRHSQGQPVRGQRTKSHFRRNKTKSGAGMKKKTKEGTA